MYLVTGGAGFIGSHIVEALVCQGKSTRILDDFSTGSRKNIPIPGSDSRVPAARGAGSVEIVEGDIRDLNVVRQAMRDVDYVVHQAALVSVPQSIADPQTTHAVNVTGTLNVLVAARQAGVRRVVFASSCAVYGDNDDLPLNENATPRPLSPYAASKLCGEMYCLAFTQAYGLPTVCLRYFNVYGPRQDPAGDYAAVIPKFVERMKAGLPPVIHGDGKQTRDFVYVGDVVRANLLASEHEAAAGQVLNVTSGRSVSLLQLVDMLNGLCGTELSPTFGPERPGDIRHSQGDGARLAGFGFKGETPLAEGLRQVVGQMPVSTIRGTRQGERLRVNTGKRIVN
jgi:UDP-glucose 4-epimerase